MSYCPRCTRPLNTAGMCDTMGCIDRTKSFLIVTFEDEKDLKIATLTRRVEELEAIVAKLPKTADGVPIVLGMKVYFECPDPEWWRVEPGTIVSETVKSMDDGVSFSEYKGTVAITCEECEFGNLECFSTEAAALAAKEVRDV